MIHTEDDDSATANSDRFRSVAERKKLRPVMKSKNICFKRSRGELQLNTLSSSRATDSSRSGGHCNSPPEDSELKLALMNLIPRDPAQETSEGVQELIKHVSEFIGKKNPFRDGSSSEMKEMKETKETKETNETAHPSSKHSMRSHSSRDTLHSSRKPKSTSGDKKGHKIVQGVAGRSLRDTVVSPKSESKSKSFSYANRRCVQMRKRLQPEPKCESTDGNEVKVKSFVKTSQNSPENENTEKDNPRAERRATKISCRTEPGKSPTTKRVKPSEIPLRKNRIDFGSKVKQTSYSTMKTVKEDNITTVDTNKKSETIPNREVQNCSRETDKENIESSPSREITPKDTFNTTDKDGGKCDTENCPDTHLSGSTKSPDSPELSNHPPSNIPDPEVKTPDSALKTRVLNLEQVRSSTFTVLTSLSSTLHRLESIHQQNVNFKGVGSEKILSSKSSKFKVLTPKTSFNLLNAKRSKKNLSSRLSSKGNKPGLKQKRRKSKTELGVTGTSVFHENIKTGSRESSRGVKNVTKPMSLIQKGDRPTSKNQNSEKDKREEKTTAAKRIDGIGRGYGFSRSKPITPKITSPKNKKGPRTPINFNRKLLATLCNSTPDKPEDSFKSYDKGYDTNVESNSESSNHKISPSSSETLSSVTTLIDRKKSEAVMSEGSTKAKPTLTALVDEQLKNRSREEIKSESKVKIRPGDLTKVKKPRESSKTSVKELKVIGTSVKLAEKRTSESPEEPEQEKVQLRITIDVKSEEDCSFSGKNITEDGKNVCSFNWLFMNQKKCDHECGQQLSDTNDPDQQEMTAKKEIIEEPASLPIDDIVAELAVSSELETGLEQHYRGSQMMMRRPRPKYKTPVMNVKTVGKKMKTRSDAGNRWFFSSKGHSNSAINFQIKMNKAKADTKMRSGFTRSLSRDPNSGSERRDHFDDTNNVKLKRRNSEPFSFRGYIWRHQDTVPPRDNKTSASSLGSSLRHLNTDDLEDFIFWESVPPRVTSCWEASLYHVKRPWSVLSCSVFNDNRLSNAPGLILENIRNGSCSNGRWPSLRQTERISDSFDVEPSITQKDIDVRNWLAALNFQNPSSASSDVIREGSESPQPVSLSQDFRTPVFPKRRKAFPGLKQSESSESKPPKDSDKYNSEGYDMGLMELIRRKSGGFVTAEQYFNSTRSQSYSILGKSNPRHRSKLNFQVLEDLEDSDVEKVTESESHIPKEEKMIQVAFEDFESPPSRPSVDILENPSSGLDEEEDEVVATPSQGSRSLTLMKYLRGDSEVVTSNVWKYLFMFTLFVLVTYYVSRSRHSCLV